MNKNTHHFFLLKSLIFLVMFSLLFGCPAPPSEPTEYPFRQISGSGYITLNILGASALNGQTILYGASGIPYGPIERGGDSEIINNDMSLDIEIGGSNFLFAGGFTIGNIGCTIDMDDNGTANDGDYVAGVQNYTINGNAAITLTYPDDFTLVTNSGLITLNIVGAQSGGISGADYMYGASGIPFGPVERGGAMDTVPPSDDFNVTVEIGGSDFMFAGGFSIGTIGCIIDVNGNGFIDNGDLFGGVDSYTVNGPAVITLNHPADFTTITGSGYITLNITGASDLNGESILYGACGIPFGNVERGGNSGLVGGDDMSLMVQIPGGTDYLFAGGFTIGNIGCTIDIDGNGTVSDGDYVAGVENYTINGDRTLILAY